MCVCMYCVLYMSLVAVYVCVFVVTGSKGGSVVHGHDVCVFALCLITKGVEEGSV